MIKKSVLILVLVCAVIMSCTACNSKNDASSDTGKAGDSSSSVQQEQETKEMPTVTTKDGSTVITKDSMVIKTGDYEILGSDCQYLTDDDMSTAWFFEYTDSTESPCDFQIWMTSNVSTMTTVQAKVTVMNLSDEERTITDLVSSQVLHDGKKAADSIMVMQINPNQVTTDGYQVPSTSPVALKQGEQADIVFLFDIKKSDMTDGKPLDLQFTINSDSYVIDLTTDLQPRTR